MSVFRRLCSFLAILAMLLGPSLHAAESIDLIGASGGPGQLAAATCLDCKGGADTKASAKAPICAQATCMAVPAAFPRAEAAFALTSASFAPAADEKIAGRARIPDPHPPKAGATI